MIENNDERLISNENPIRERVKKRNATDFSSSSLRRIALTQLGRKR
ncbi:hypothetical protein [Fredinandcohnia onubensis]|nr:hypothetical protein [Fredinandcohnia onubensis]